LQFSSSSTSSSQRKSIFSPSRWQADFPSAVFSLSISRCLTQYPPGLWSFFLARGHLLSHWAPSSPVLFFDWTFSWGRIPLYAFSGLLQVPSKYFQGILRDSCLFQFPFFRPFGHFLSLQVVFPLVGGSSQEPPCALQRARAGAYFFPSSSPLPHPLFTGPGTNSPLWIPVFASDSLSQLIPTNNLLFRSYVRPRPRNVVGGYPQLSTKDLLS